MFELFPDAEPISLSGAEAETLWKGRSSNGQEWLELSCEKFGMAKDWEDLVDCWEKDMYGWVLSSSDCSLSLWQKRCFGHGEFPPWDNLFMSAGYVLSI